MRFVSMRRVKLSQICFVNACVRYDPFSFVRFRFCCETFGYDLICQILFSLRCEGLAANA